ncbi:aspartate beta-hydroxylase domain-containing protein 2-like [Branchiostoma lanceolatum]|uniref:aspartate beta-hydroxylase domain-containing protein 2-like n=1 Tax=Branchiostoma lanceolatum TaxID=7740 RepID=UPI003451F954
MFDPSTYSIAYYFATFVAVCIATWWYCNNIQRHRTAMLNSSAGEETYSKCTSPGCLRCRSNSHARGLMLQKLVKHFHDNNLPIGAVQRVIKALQVEEEDLEGVRHPLQQPTVLYLQDLDTKPVWTDSIMLEQDVKTLEKNAEILQSEFSAIIGENGWKINNTPTGQWKALYLINQGVPVQETCQKCPKTAKILGKLKFLMNDSGFGNACFSVVDPGTHITGHYGPCNVRVRCHLGVQVPEGCAITVGGRRLTWTDGRCLLFDDSFFHEVHHHGNQKDPPRVVFMVDLWHPQVTSLERKALNFLYPPQ